jgi:ABC-2 type transport system permease protein
MYAEFKHTLRRQRGAMISWSIGLFLYGLMMMSFYSNIQMMEGFMENLQNYPAEMLAFFPDIFDIMTPAGYLETYFFSYMPIIIGIYAITTCTGLLVGDEEKGMLDLTIAHPISRSGLFWGRFLAFMFALIVILVVSWLGWVIPLGGSGMDVSPLELLLPFIPLYAVLGLFGAFALLLSLLLPSVRLAAGLTGLVLVGNFLLIGIANLNEDLKPIYELTPLRYFQGGGAMDGLNWGWVAGLFGFGLLLLLLAWWRFEKRDIRVGGEGGWELPSWRSLRKRRSSSPT